MFNDPKSRWVLVVLPRYYFTWKPWRLLGGRDVNGTASIVLLILFQSLAEHLVYEVGELFHCVRLSRYT